MALLHFQDVDIGFGGPLLIEGARLAIDRGQRIGVVGRNGAGKTTLLKVITGEVEPLAGKVVIQQDVRIAMLDQQVPADMRGSVFDEVALGLGEWGEILARYHSVSVELETRSDPALLREMDRLQERLQSDGGWSMHQRVEKVLSRMELDPDLDASSLSAGLKRRVLLARTLVLEPDLLLLDEPTNHLDIEAIDWIEEFLLRFEGTLLFITHDRALLRRVATRVVSVDRARVKCYDCDYTTFVRRYEADLEAEAELWAERTKKLAREEAWAKQGIKARRTRAQGRVTALKKLRADVRERRRHAGPVRIRAEAAERSGQLVIETLGLSYQWNDEPLIRDFSTLVLRGDKIGLMGPNGSGKTTLLQLLLKELKPVAGSVRHGTKLQVAYFDQLHRELDENLSVRGNVSDNDFVIIGERKRHIVGYMQDFLFPPARLDSSVKTLSGGERNRLLLAKLFTRPSNVLVMDEPTNDLDAETLDLLEDMLVEYSGTILLVSHDREFLNNVVTSTMVLEDDGKVGEYAGGYDDWLVQRKSPSVGTPTSDRPSTPSRPTAPTGPRKRTYKEKFEYDELPQKIEALEAEKEEIHETMSADGFYTGDPDRIARVSARLQELEPELEAAYERWAELDELA